MDRLERLEHPQQALTSAMESWQSGIWTAMPGIILSFDPLEKTASVQLAIQVQVTNQETNKKDWTNISNLVDCPVYFPSGGGCTLTFPVKAGDECLVVFSSRCIDSWWQSGGYKNPQTELRMHDLSDGFVFVGFSSLPNIQTNISTTDIQLRSNDGVASISLNPTNHKVTILAAELNITGDVHITGALTNNGKAVGSTLKVSGVQTGTGNSGNPI